jgi:uncharacterized membrane protein
MERVPLAKTIYGATRTLIDSFRGGPQGGGQRVVLIEFPNPEMRAVGFVTATFQASDTGEDLAAVYVPATPNPTSGYLEIVPTRRLVWLDWSTADAMSFIVSGGALTPGRIAMHPSLHRAAAGLPDENASSADQKVSEVRPWLSPGSPHVVEGTTGVVLLQAAGPTRNLFKVRLLTWLRQFLPPLP